MDLPISSILKNNNIILIEKIHKSSDILNSKKPINFFEGIRYIQKSGGSIDINDLKKNAVFTMYTCLKGRL